MHHHLHSTITYTYLVKKQLVRTIIVLHYKQFQFQIVSIKVTGTAIHSNPLLELVGTDS